MGARYRSRRATLATTLAWTRWRHIQADLIDGYGFPTTANIGDGRVISLGVNGEVYITPQLRIEAALYWNHSRVTDPYLFATFNAAGDVVLAPQRTRKDRLPNIADLTGRIGMRYIRPLTGSSTLQMSGYARFVGKSILGVGEELGQLQGNYVDTGLDVRIGNARRGLSLTLTNLFDARGNRFALGSPLLVRDRNQITPLQPRSLRIGFDAQF